MIEEDLLADLDYLESCLDETRNAILKVIELANAKLDAEEVDRLRAKKKQIYEDLKSEQSHNMKSELKYDPETGEPLIDGYPLYSGLPKGEEHMKFIDWWIEFSRGCPLDMTESEMAKQAWEAGIQEGIGRKREADLKIGAWLSAALEDPSTCQSMKDDINEWFECTPQVHRNAMQT